MHGNQFPRGPLEAQVGYRRRLLRLGGALLLLCASALLVALLAIQHAAAQSQDAQQGAPCGQTRFVLVRYLDGNPVSGVRAVFSAAPPSIGGPELYTRDASSQPAEIQGHPDGMMPTLPALLTPGAGCHPVITGTLGAVTNAQGIARFDGLGEGTWTVRFEGSITRETTGGHQMASLVRAAVQGRAPYGRTREGGGFIERIDALNEEGGPNPEPVQPGVGATTSRYLVRFSTEYGGWLPELDLASKDDVPPLPLADVTPEPTTPAAWVAPAAPAARVALADPTSPNLTPVMVISNSQSGIISEISPVSSSQESAFNPSSVELAPSEDQDQRLSQGGGHYTGGPSFTVWWLGLRCAPLIGLTLGGVVAIVWGKRRANSGKRVRK